MRVSAGLVRVGVGDPAFDEYVREDGVAYSPGGHDPDLPEAGRAQAGMVRPHDRGRRTAAALGVDPESSSRALGAVEQCFSGDRHRR
jgi:hypothetical protein